MKGILCQITLIQSKKNSCRSLGIDEEKVTEEASFIDDLGADSLDTVSCLWPLKKNLIGNSIARQRKF